MMLTTKRMIHLALATAASAALIVLAIEACGGHLIVGYDDAGHYHTADGAVLVSGSMCVGFDASAYINNPKRLCDPSKGKTECTAWYIPPSLPSGVIVSYCKAGIAQVDDAGNPVLDDSGTKQLVDYDSGICDPPTYGAPPDGFWVAACAPPLSDSGDEFCSAFFNQYITNGTVLASCSGSGGCLPDFRNGVERCGGGLVLTVQLADGGIACLDPCQP
jgi:hypothetical protein